MVRGRKGENASKRKGHALLWLRMIICPPIRTVCESREILLLPCTCVHARLLLAVVCVAPIEDNNRPICSIRHFSSSSFSFFFFFFFFGGGSTGAPRLLKAFRIHDSQKLNWNCSNRSPVSSFARISRVLLLVLFHTLQFHRVLRLIIFAALFPSITCLDRSIDRWDMQNNKIIGIFL